MLNSKALFLHQEVMLLALRDDKGTIDTGSMYQYAIGGAVIAELLLNERIKIERIRRKDLVTLQSSRPLEDSLLNQCLAMIASARRKIFGSDLGLKIRGHKKFKTYCSK